MQNDLFAVKQALLSMQRMSWEQGVAAQAFFECGDPQMGLLMVNEAIHRGNGRGLIGITNAASDSVDCGSNGLPAYYAYLYTKDEQYLKAAKALADWFVYSAPRSASGHIYHNPGTHRNMIDGIYHIIPVLIVTGHIDFAMEQIQLFHDKHYDLASGLYRQFWDDDTNSFCRRDLWGGGQGWMAGALALACKYMPKEKANEHKKLAELLDKLVDSMQAYMCEDYMFHDVVDDPSTFKEITASLMMCYAIYIGISAGALPHSKKILADEILTHAKAHVDDLGYVNNACSSPHFNRLGRSAEAQAFYILCISAR